MHKSLEAILQLITEAELPEEGKTKLLKALTEADKQFAIIEFKLDRTEKVKRTTSILLEETIEELEQKRKAIEESKDALQKSLEELKATQSQLIQSEKMASLGELTAGIAHEIQNPLNFVNNFSELNVELVEELRVKNEELGVKDADVSELLKDIKSNSEKINHHGKRADGIVKGMLQHSRTSSGQKEPTDINALCDEYLRLAYHGLRAKDKTFNAEFKTEFDETIGNINIIPQEMGRVILNLINNAFYACTSTPLSVREESYSPLVTVTTKKIGSNIEISVTDNGTGIPQHIKEKIFQPFFTTKPTGQGTGLGLSLAYDIVTKGHGGKLVVESEEGKGTTFIVTITIQ
jgi:two-component system, NtrC family, sensor kinase